MGFDFVEEYYDPMTFTEGVIESHSYSGEEYAIRIEIDKGKQLILSREEAVKLAIKIYSYCFQEDWSYLQ